MVGEVEIRPALEADGATIRAMARAACIGPHLAVEDRWRIVVGIWQVRAHKGDTRELASWVCFQSTSGGHRRRIRMRPARVCLANGFCFGKALIGVIRAT